MRGSSTSTTRGKQPSFIPTLKFIFVALSHDWGTYLARLWKLKACQWKHETCMQMDRNFLSERPNRELKSFVSPGKFPLGRPMKIYIPTRIFGHILSGVNNPFSFQISAGSRLHTLFYTKLVRSAPNPFPCSRVPQILELAPGALI